MSITYLPGAFAIVWNAIQQNLFSGQALSFNSAFNFQQNYVSGAGAGKYQNTADILANAATGGGTNFDLTALANANPFITSVSFATVDKVLIVNMSTTPGENIVVSPGASNGFYGPLAGTSLTHTLKPGDALAWVTMTPWTVDGTHKILNLTAASGTPQFKLTMSGS